MLLKRKRSTTTLSSPASDSTITNTVQSFYPPTKPTPSPLHEHTKLLPSPYEPETPSHLNARTRKRHRDNRPDASTVHGSSTTPCWLGAVIKMSALADVCRVTASTIQRLYDAQRANNAIPQAEESLAQQQQAQQQQQQRTTQQALPQPQKSTLHSFWQIPQPVPTATQVQQNACAEEARCEDCEGTLRSEDSMDVDDSSVEDKACESCRRRICDGCAVWGRERVCRVCAGGGW